MELLSNAALSDNNACPYLDNKEARFTYFFARELSSAELGKLISCGFRKFGMYYFCPSCDDCQKCIPLRVKAREIVPTKSQLRALKKAADIRVEFVLPLYSEELFDIYADHSASRFDKNASRDEFYTNFFVKSCPSIMSLYYAEEQLVAAGLLDITDDGLSSVYFMYREAFSHLSLGTVSVFREAAYALKLKLPYYYLGYYIEECGRMKYKGQFRPHQLYSWDRKMWIDAP